VWLRPCALQRALWLASLALLTHPPAPVCFACLVSQFYLGNYQQSINEGSTIKLGNKDFAVERDVFLMRAFIAQKKVTRLALASL